MQTIKNIRDENLKDDDIVRYHCSKCNNNTLFRITVAEDGVCGICSKCREWSVLKKNENYIPPNDSTKPTVECPYCRSTNTKKISGLSKAGSVAMFGVFAVGKVSKQFHCNNCGADF